MNRKNTIVGALLFLAAVNAGAQIVREEHIFPPIVYPADPKDIPAQSPASRTSAGAVIIKYKAEMLDKDRDGKVSKVEADGIPELITAFDKLDRDRDGRLDQVELDAFTK